MIPFRQHPALLLPGIRSIHNRHPGLRINLRVDLKAEEMWADLYIHQPRQQWTIRLGKTAKEARDVLQRVVAGYRTEGSA